MTAAREGHVCVSRTFERSQGFGHMEEREAASFDVREAEEANGEKMEDNIHHHQVKMYLLCCFITAYTEPQCV